VVTAYDDTLYLYAYTSTGDSFTTLVEIKLIAIHCLQPPSNQSFCLASNIAETVRSGEEDIYGVRSSRSQASSNFNIYLPAPTLL